MRKIFLIVVMLLFSQQFIYAQAGPDADKPKEDTTEAVKNTGEPKTEEPAVTKDEPNEPPATLAKNTTDSTKCACIPHAKTNPDTGEWVLIFIPLAIFFILFWSIGRGNGFSFKDALTESDQTKQTTANPQYTAENMEKLKDTPNLSVLLPPTIEVTPLTAEYRPSISRYIAFITSLFTLIIALSMSSFFIYHYVSSGCPPDFGALSTILIALSIGLAPYAVNKASSVVKNKSE